MKMKMIGWLRQWIAYLGLAGLLLGWGTGCGTTPSEREAKPYVPGGTNAGPGAAMSSPDLIREGDKLEIIFTDVPGEFPVMAKQVQEDGTITLPLGVKVQAAGLKAGELQDKIRAEYVPKYFKRLTVGIKPEERVFYVGGMVRNPGRYPFAGGLTVLGAIKVAGDFNEFAKRTAVRVTHADGTSVLVDCKKALKDSKFDPPVFPGDRIDVDRKIL